MKTFFSYVALLSAVVVIIGAITLLAANPPLHPLSPQEQRFLAFANAYVNAYDAHRLAKFEREVKGQSVEWEGMVTDVSPTGENFNMVPVVGPTGSNGQPRMAAFVCLKPGTELLPMIREYSRVRVKGKIHSVSVLSTIVEAEFVSVVY